MITDSDGYFALRGLLPGVWRVSCTHPELNCPDAQTVDLSDVDVQDVDLIATD